MDTVREKGWDILVPYSIGFRTRPRGLLILAWLLVAGCATPSPVSREPVDPPPAFSRSGQEAVPDRWWVVFGESALDARVRQALEGNFGLEAAWERLREARALVRRESAPLRPTLDATLDGEIRRGVGADDETLGLGLAAGYEVDLWGRIGALADAEALRAEAEFADYRAAALTLAAEVVRTWFGIAEASARLRLQKEQLRANEQVLELIRARVSTGQLRSVDVLRQQELLEATREEAIVAEARRRILLHRMDVLLGRPPENGAAVPEARFVALPPLPDTGLPAELVRRRPDVARARRLVLAADRSLAAAMSSRYPRLDLTLVLSTAEDSTRTLFSDWLRSFAAGLIQPLFDGGRRTAEVDRNRALRNRRLAEYGQTVLESFREVEDALVRESEQTRRLESLETQVDFAGEAVKRLRTDYLNGVGDYLDVLAALTDEQQLRRDLLTGRLRLVEARIALYRALAGGFATPREEEEDSR